MRLSRLARDVLTGLGGVLLVSSAAFAQAPGTVPAADPNAFNRILTPPPPPAKTLADTGIYDPASPGLKRLQSPLQAYAGLPPAQAGNRVDWVKAFRAGTVKPRADLNNPDARLTAMDNDVVRGARGTIGNVVFPHKAHTEWLACVSCHDAIYQPKKGVNQMSMAAINNGESCGVCHGTVAFPVSDCARCHIAEAPVAAPVAKPDAKEAKGKKP
jgi:c(7)-type cytochrome triheme protein